MNFENSLNEDQLAAVTAPDGPALVIAAAGTGKTRTLVYRVAWLIAQGADPSSMLLLTFTNKAAREMLDRAATLTQGAVNGLLSGTFHHLANRLLRRHAPAIGFGHDYSILDQDDAKKLLKSCTDDLNLTGKHVPKPQVLLSLFGLASGSRRPLADLAEEWFEEAHINTRDVLRLHQQYSLRKKEINAMDFDDLILLAVKLLNESPDLLEQVQQRYRHILVDEYQDTNTEQTELIDLLAAGHRNLMVVGDDFQSIYAWRGADYRNFLSFPDRYPDATVYKLQTNYRSTPEILDVANSAIRHNPQQFQKTLRATRHSLSAPTVARLRDGSDQADYVIRKFRQLQRQGIKPAHIAVLYRSHFHAMELQMALTREQIPYHVTSGIRFFEQAHIKDACAILRLLENPADELSFKRLLELFPKVGERTADKLWKKCGAPFDARDPAARARLQAALPAMARTAWEALDPLFLDCSSSDLLDDPGEIIFRFMKSFYTEYLFETFDNAKHRSDDMHSLIDFTARFENTAAFLSEMALLTNLDAAVDARQRAQEDGLRLSTVHQAKGLEWKAVFILWMNEDCFPAKKSLEQGGGEAEERRLFYVAATRAEDHLFFCCPESRRTREGGLIPYVPSRFIRELPPRLLHTEHC